MCGRHTSHKDGPVIYHVSELETADFSAIRKKKCSHLSALSFGSTQSFPRLKIWGVRHQFLMVSGEL
ncbi:hypothetical protein H5410_059213, partial [Solanum commersonii]